jgi:hypothetical protein
LQKIMQQGKDVKTALHFYRCEDEAMSRGFAPGLRPPPEFMG